MRYVLRRLLHVYSLVVIFIHLEALLHTLQVLRGITLGERKHVMTEWYLVIIDANIHDLLRNLACCVQLNCAPIVGTHADYMALQMTTGLCLIMFLKFNVCILLIYLLITRGFKRLSLLHLLLTISILALLP